MPLKFQVCCCNDDIVAEDVKEAVGLDNNH